MLHTFRILCVHGSTQFLCDDCCRRELKQGPTCIGCGNGLAQDSSAAQQADNSNPANLPILNQIIPHTNYTAQCHSAVSGRRAWTIPVTIVGLMAIAGSFFVGGRAGARTL